MTRRLLSAVRLTMSSGKNLRHGLSLLAGCLTGKGRQTFARSFDAAPGGAARIGLEHQRWRAARLAARRARYAIRAGAEPRGLFSLLTTVYDTRAEYVRELAGSVFGQTLGDFEWVLLDNGSTDPDTIAVCRELSSDPRVRYLRVEENLGIIGGIRRCFETAQNRYAVPVDSDDLLTEDALAVFAHFIAKHGSPPLLYSDEDKVRDGVFYEAYQKPAWDPVLFANSCYIAHLCAVRRDLGSELALYTDAEATGSHDWDTFFRFWHAGHVPVHVPEILYSWRVHPLSCAGDIHSKGYIYSSHRRVLGEDLARLPEASRFELVASPLFEGTPDWWARRRRMDPPPLGVITVLGSRSAPRRRRAEPRGPFRHHERVREEELTGRLPELAARLCDPSAPRSLVALVWDDVSVAGEEWAWDAIGLFERFPDTAVVGGRTLAPDGSVWSAGETFGVHGLCGSPDRSRSVREPGYFAWLWKQRSVSAVAPWLCVVDARFLRSFCERVREWSPRWLGAWLGGMAHAENRRIVYTPHFSARLGTTAGRDDAMPGGELAAFCGNFPACIPDARFYPSTFGLGVPHLYQPVEPSERRDHLRIVLARQPAAPAR
jgi:hypothetical protein